MTSLITQDPELARIYRAGLTDRAALSEQDQSRFDPLLSVQVTGLQHQFRLARDGSLSPEVWADMKQADRWLVQQPGVRPWWLLWRNLYRPDFQEFYDDLIREGEAAG